MFEFLSSISNFLTGVGKSAATPLSSMRSPLETGNSTGGRKRGGKRIMKGGYTDNIAVSGLAANAAPFSGETAKPQTMVGGKTRKRKGGKAKKSRRSR